MYCIFVSGFYSDDYFGGKKKQQNKKLKILYIKAHQSYSILSSMKLIFSCFILVPEIFLTLQEFNNAYDL